MAAYLEYPFIQANLLLKALTVSRKICIPLTLDRRIDNIDAIKVQLEGQQLTMVQL